MLAKFESFKDGSREFIDWLKKNPEILEMIDIIDENLSILSDDIDFDPIHDIHYNFSHVIFYGPKDKHGKYVPVFSEDDEEELIRFQDGDDDDDEFVNLTEIQKKLNGFRKIEFERVVGVSTKLDNDKDLEYLRSICKVDNISIKTTWGEGGDSDFQLRFSKELDLSYFKKNDPFNKIPKNLIKDFEEFANSINLTKSEDRQKLVDLFDKYKRNISNETH